MSRGQYKALSFEDRVKIYTIPDPVTGCHNFVGPKDTGGYGQLRNKGQLILVHRWTWMRENTVVPSTVHICHHCDNPACVNPEHLYAGNNATNMRDKKERGRSKNVPTGYAHKRPNAKLTGDQVAAIKLDLLYGKKQIELVRKYGVTRNLISEINLGKTWRHITVCHG